MSADIDAALGLAKARGAALGVAIATLNRVIKEASKFNDPDAERWDHDIVKPHHFVQEALSRIKERLDDDALLSAADELLDAALVRVSCGHHSACLYIPAIGAAPALGACGCGHDALVAAVKKAQGEG